MEFMGEKEGIPPGMPKFDVSKHPAVVMNILCSVVLFVGDPDLVQEMWTTKVKHFTKHSIVVDLFKPIMFNHFVMLPTNEQWRTERKALSQMFYKEKMRIMIKIVK